MRCASSRCAEMPRPYQRGPDDAEDARLHGIVRQQEWDRTSHVRGALQIAQRVDLTPICDRQRGALCEEDATPAHGPSAECGGESAEPDQREDLRQQREQTWCGRHRDGGDCVLREGLACLFRCGVQGGLHANRTMTDCQMGSEGHQERKRNEELYGCGEPEAVANACLILSQQQRQ